MKEAPAISEAKVKLDPKRKARSVWMLGHEIKVQFASSIVLVLTDGSKGTAQGTWDPQEATITIHSTDRPADKVASVLLHELVHACHSYIVQFDPSAIDAEAATNAAEIGLFSFFRDARNKWAVDMLTGRKK